MSNQFNVSATPAYENGDYSKPVWRYMLRQYQGSGTASVVESKETWATKDEAAAVCARVNSGDKTGLTFAMYSDD
jgi:hypothetical protein